jgi:glycerophosphoryl diester phosphodiesterase
VSHSDSDIVGAVRAALHDARLVWLQLAIADLGTRIAATLVLTPLLTLTVRWAVHRSGSSAITDHDILWFVLSPLGLVTLLLVVCGSSFAGLFSQAALMTIGAGAMRRGRVTWAAGIRHASRRLPAILELASRTVIQLLLLAVPFVIAAGLVVLLLLGDHDINYYLARRPPRFWVAACLVTACAAILVWIVGRRLLSWMLALPRLLFGPSSARDALRASVELMQGRQVTALGVLGAWAIATVLLSAVLTAASGGLGDWLIPHTSQRLYLVATAVGIALALAVIFNLAVSIAAGAVLALVVLHLDRAWADSWVAPAVIGSAAERPATRGRVQIPGWAWLGAILTVSGLVFGGGILIVNGIDLQDHVEIMAHRGASGRAPENTDAAVRAAIEDDAHWVEIDVQETADGVVVVHHDADFMRLAGDARNIWDLDHHELADLDIGSWYGPAFATERVITLAEVLELCRDRIGVIIELKTYGRGQRLEERVVELVEQHRMVDQVMLMSLDRAIVERLRSIRPDWTVGRLAAVAAGDLTRIDADFLAVTAKVATPAFVRRAHRRGKQVLVWTVNNPVQMSDMISRGVDGLITDLPALAGEVLRVRSEMGALERLLISAGSRLDLTEGSDVSSSPEDA